MPVALRTASATRVPEGALRRFGTTRPRRYPQDITLFFSPDGKANRHPDRSFRIRDSRRGQRRGASGNSTGSPPTVPGASRRERGPPNDSPSRARSCRFGTWKGENCSAKAHSPNFLATFPAGSRLSPDGSKVVCRPNGECLRLYDTMDPQEAQRVEDPGREEFCLDGLSPGLHSRRENCGRHGSPDYPNRKATTPEFQFWDVESGDFSPGRDRRQKTRLGPQVPDSVRHEPVGFTPGSATRCGSST